MQRLGVQSGDHLASRPRRPLPAVAGVEGRLLQTEAGSCFLVEELYGADSCHGDLPLRAFGEIGSHWLCLEQERPDLTALPGGVAFLDIETTGLSDGAGTYAFLVGLGRFEGEAFHLYQIFMRSPAEERALLLVLANLLKDTQMLVSYNGKGFDLPVLQSRYTLARIDLPWSQQYHVDLLAPARKLWRHYLPNCKLSSLEEHLLGVQRDTIDLPGWRIPSLYYAYLQGADSTELWPVFYHNAQDILSLVTLSVYLDRFLQDPWGQDGSRHGLEFYALGRLYEQADQAKEAERAYRSALLLSLPLELRERTWKQLSFLLKRGQAWEQAVEIWQALTRRPTDAPLYAYIELAKYYEHQCQDLEQAAAVVREAIACYGEQALGEDLAHRLNRLQRRRKHITRKKEDLQ
ncbi:MAG: ribonuclease H-like domain-containing protein [Chloroflexia bacterium]|nr:ribonuclease H-like domain-containing protein [Chloroflexia bacterium]